MTDLQNSIATTDTTEIVRQIDCILQAAENLTIHRSKSDPIYVEGQIRQVSLIQDLQDRFDERYETSDAIGGAALMIAEARRLLISIS